MALEIIGAGFGRTGTMSLKLALERLGFGPCHHMKEVISDPVQTRLWSEAAAGTPDFERVFVGYKSAVDFPVAAFWPEVLETYPDARIILSSRSAQSWYSSFSETILRIILDRQAWPESARPWYQMLEDVVVKKCFAGRTDRDGIMAAFEANEAAARKAVESDRFFVFEASQGWGPLCDFLKVDLPGEPFPRTNAREIFFRSVDAGTKAASG